MAGHIRGQPAKDGLQRLIIETRDAVRNWRYQMSSNVDVSYDMDEMGSCLIQTLAIKARARECILTFAENFARTYRNDEYLRVKRAMLELATEVSRVIDRISIHDANGVLNYHFDRWHNDDLVLIQLPY